MLFYTMEPLRYTALLTLMIFVYQHSLSANFREQGIYFNILSASTHTVEVCSSGNSSITYNGAISIPPTVTHNGTTYTVISVAENAFRNSRQLISLHLPYTISSVGEGTFIGCQALRTITVDRDNPHYTSIDGTLYNAATTTLIAFPPALTDIHIPEGVTHIAPYAFYQASNIATIKLPSTVTTIGYRSFSGCNALKSMTLSYNLELIDTQAFYYTSSLTDIYSPSPMPPVSLSPFDDIVNNSATLHIPLGTTSRYAAEYPWSNFTSLHEMQFSSIHNIDIINPTNYILHNNTLSFAIPTHITIYNINGHIVHNGITSRKTLPPGIYLILCNGTTSKIRIQ